MSDLLLLGRTTIEEARALLYWAETEEGYKKVGVCGLSMGTWAFTSRPLTSLRMQPGFFFVNAFLFLLH